MRAWRRNLTDEKAAEVRRIIMMMTNGIMVMMMMMMMVMMMIEKEHTCVQIRPCSNGINYI